MSTPSTVLASSTKAGGNSAKEEATESVQRRTKWGLDRLDAAVRKGKALAYQELDGSFVIRSFKFQVSKLSSNRDHLEFWRPQMIKVLSQQSSIWMTALVATPLDKES